MLKEENIKKYIFWIVVSLLLVICYFIIQPYLIALISAFIVAYLVLPIHRKLSKKIKPAFSALISVLIITFIILLPLSLLATALISQLTTSVNYEQISTSITDFIALSQIGNFLNLNVNTLKEQLVEFSIGIIRDAVPYIPTLAISVLIFLLSTFYFLLSWDYVSGELKQFLPFRDKENVSKELGKSTKNIIYGYFLIAILEFIIGGIGFYFSGVRLYLLLPALMGLLAFVPGVGPGLIWLPLSLYNLATGDYLTGIGVLITGLVISIFIETIFYGKIIGFKARIHPLIIFLGVFGGVPIFGIFGFIIGPLIIVYTIKLVQEAVKTN